MANYVYVVTETNFRDDYEDHIIGVVCSNKKTAVKAVNLAMSQIINKSKWIYTKKSWYKDDASNWCKSIDWANVNEDAYTRLTIIKKEVI